MSTTAYDLNRRLLTVDGLVNNPSVEVGGASLWQNHFGREREK